MMSESEVMREYRAAVRFAWSAACALLAVLMWFGYELLR